MAGRTVGFVTAIFIVTGTTMSFAQTGPTKNAADLYAQAAAKLVVESPANSNLEYPDYPPYGDAWDTLARDAWEKNADARALTREGTRANVGWPVGDERVRALGVVRTLSFEVSDAALYRGLQGHSGDAIDLLDDTLRLAHQLCAQHDELKYVRTLVATSVDSTLASRAMALAPDLRDAAQVGAIKRLIDHLLAVPDSRQLLVAGFGGVPTLAEAEADEDWQVSLSRARTMLARADADRRMAAMSLACQLYRIDHDRWPSQAGDLVPAYLASVPLDPAGDGAAPLGYALIAKGLPDGGDRPLVYSRLESRDGLMYRTDAPQYGYYQMDGSNRPAREYLKAGQFRDVARWAPASPSVPTETPALKPLP